MGCDNGDGCARRLLASEEPRAGTFTVFASFFPDEVACKVELEALGFSTRFTSLPRLA